jgi:hypothetical protein
MTPLAVIALISVTLFAPLVVAAFCSLPADKDWCEHYHRRFNERLDRLATLTPEDRQWLASRGWDGR